MSWRVLIAWDGDTYVDETANVYYAEYKRGTTHLLKPDGKGFEKPTPGSGKLLVRNGDGRYDAFNTSSPIYPNVVPGRPVVLQVAVDDVWYTRFRGRVADIRPTKSRGARAAELKLVEDWAILDSAAYTDVYENVYADEAITHILDRVGWPADKRALDPGLDIHRYWWAGGDKALDEILSVASAEFGRVWLDADGILHFKNRHALYEYAAELNASNLRPETSLSQPWDVVRNTIYVPVSSFRTLENVEVWTLTQPIFVGGGATVTVWANYTYENMPVRVTQLYDIQPGDVTANTSADGSGDNMTAVVDVTVTSLSSVARIDLHNTSRTPLYVTAFVLRGDGLQVIEASTVVVQDATSVDRFGLREFRVETPWVENASVATDYANFLRVWLAQPVAYPQVVLRGQPTVQAKLDVGQIVSVDLPEEYLYGDYLILSIDERWLDKNGRVFETKVTLNPQFAFDKNFWTFPTTIGITSRFGY